MNYRPLGRTGLDVSVVSLGTVSLGRDYGLKVPGNSGKPSDAAAREVIQRALEVGINLFDTSPGYGAAEALLGATLGSRRDCYVATKVPLPPVLQVDGPDPSHARRAIYQSLENSLRALGRDTLDIVQINNPTAEQLRDGQFTSILHDARREGLLRWVGASVYGERAALAAIDVGTIDVLHVAYNLLDQRMASRVFPAARQAGVGIMVRSAFLQGVLTPKGQWLPPALSALGDAADRARGEMAETWETLPSAAFRFCLSAPAVATTLTGARTIAELEDAVSAAAAGPLPPQMIERAARLAIDDERLIDPTNWPVI